MAYFLRPDAFAGGPNALFFEYDIDWPLDKLKAAVSVPPSAVRAPFRVTTKQRRVPDFIFFNVYCHGVSDLGLELLQEFSASIATFPIEIIDRQGALIPGAYHYLNVTAVCDSLVFDEQNCIYVERLKAYRIVEEKLVMRGNDIKGVPIWHEEFPGHRRTYELFASEELVEAAKKRGLTGLKSALRIAEV